MSAASCIDCGLYVPTQYARLCDSCMDADVEAEGSLEPEWFKASLGPSEATR